MIKKLIKKFLAPLVQEIIKEYAAKIKLSPEDIDQIFKKCINGKSKIET